MTDQEIEERLEGILLDTIALIHDAKKGFSKVIHELESIGKEKIQEIYKKSPELKELLEQFEKEYSEI